MAFQTGSKSSLKMVVTDTATIRFSGGVVDDDSSSSEGDELNDQQNHVSDDNKHVDPAGCHTGLQGEQSPQARVHAGAHGVDNKHAPEKKLSDLTKGIPSSDGEERVVTGPDKEAVRADVYNHANRGVSEEQKTDTSKHKVYDKEPPVSPHTLDKRTANENDASLNTSSTSSRHTNYPGASGVKRFNPFNRNSDLDEQDTFPQLTERQLIDQHKKLSRKCFFVKVE